MKESSKTFLPFNAMYKYASLAKIALKDTLYYPNKALSEIFVAFIRVCVLLVLYSYAYQYFGKSVNGISLPVACWSIAIYFILLSVNARRIFREINDDIVSGKVETLVNKPIGYLAYKVSLQFGSNFLNGIITLLGACLILVVFIGVPVFVLTPLWILEVILLTILGLTLAYLIYIVVALAAFWLNNATPLYWITDKSILILGGSYIPVALFPDIIKTIARFSPFGASMFSTYIFYPNFVSDAPKLLAIQIGWILVAFFLVKVIYGAAERKLTVNGG